MAGIRRPGPPEPGRIQHGPGGRYRCPIQHGPGGRYRCRIRQRPAPAPVWRPGRLATLTRPAPVPPPGRLDVAASRSDLRAGGPRTDDHADHRLWLGLGPSP